MRIIWGTGAVLILALIVVLIVAGVSAKSHQRDQCRGLNGTYVAGGKYGDDACFGPDGRLIQKW